VASVSRSEREESRICSDVLLYQLRPSRQDGRTCGAISIDPRRMAALAPAIVIVNGLRRIARCFVIRGLTRADGINREPTAIRSAHPAIAQREILTFNKLRVIGKGDTGK